LSYQYLSSHNDMQSDCELSLNLRRNSTMKQVIIAALMLAAFSIPVTTALVAMIVVVAPTSAYAQIGAISKYSKQGWRNGV
jgi:hypothetical protein